LIEKRKFYRKEHKKHKNDSNSNNFKSQYNFLTKQIREEIDSLKNNEWSEFIKKQGSNPLNTKPFWQRINKLRGNKSSTSIPTLKKDNLIFANDEEKANLFSSILTTTFSNQQNEKFDDKFKGKVDKFINNHDFSKHSFAKKNASS